MKTPTPGTRHDFKTGQYFPPLDGKDISPSSFSEERALAIAEGASVRSTLADDTARENTPSVRPLTVNCLHYGPDSEGNGQIWTNDVPSKQVRVATVYGTTGDGDDIEQYTKLLASAPGLLAALQCLIPGLEDLAELAKRSGDIGMRNLILEKIDWCNSAIAKATGTTL